MWNFFAYYSVTKAPILLIQKKMIDDIMGDTNQLKKFEVQVCNSVGLGQKCRTTAECISR